MKVEEAVQHMTKSYLHRVIDSFTRDLPKGDEDKSRDLILRNIEELTDSHRVENVLGFEGIYSDQILLRGILEALVNALDHRLPEDSLVEKVVAAESAVITEAAVPDCLRYEDARGIEIFEAVLEVALADDELSSEELRLIHRLREKLDLSERTKRLILARMNHFPRAGNRVHTPSDFRDALIDLQRRGVLLYCNKLEGGQFLVPEEVVPAIRAALEIELSPTAWLQLLEHLSKSHLCAMLENAGLPKSGKKEDQRDRVIAAGLRPSKSLDSLSNQELYDVCSSLPGAKVGGSKQDKVDRVIEYFANLVRKEVPKEASPGELYYQYLVELASRDRESLLANQVIKKDIDIERAFEEGTRYLVTEKLGLELIKMPGSDHPDGAFRLKRSKDLLMWDNKSKESAYDFPPAHLKQFKRYIRDSAERVSCFLVIGPEITQNCEENALRLKVDSGRDTDIALISAENMAWVAENWRSFNDASAFDPEVFNHTGILTRQNLKQRMRLFL
jgi:hypothetical protein